jgi:hypothetical protein
MGADHSCIGIVQHSDGAFPGEDDIEDKIAGLYPKHLLASQFQPRDGILVKNALTVRADTNFAVEDICCYVHRPWDAMQYFS